MAGIWVYSEDIVLIKQMLTLGRQLADQMGQPLWALMLDQQEAKSLIAAGADKVCVLKGASNWPESYAQAVVDLAAKEEPQAVLIGATLRGKDLAAKAAAKLKAGLVTDAIAVRCNGSCLETDRMMYGGLAVCTETLMPPALVTVPPCSYDESGQDSSRSGEIVTVAVAAETGVTVSSVCPIVRQGADITAADKIICVGRGLAKQEDLKLATELANVLGGEVGCTRSIAEDYHWLPAETYIGLSGQKIKPALYLSMGVSGQIQHVSGIRDAKVIVAIDTNETAPIFAAADYGIVGDLYEIVPVLTSEIQKAKQG